MNRGSNRHGTGGVAAPRTTRAVRVGARCAQVARGSAVVGRCPAAAVGVVGSRWWWCVAR